MSSSLPSLLIRNALLLAPNTPEGCVSGQDILIEGDSVARVGGIDAQTAAGCDRVIDASGMLLAPGLVNAHVHSPSSIMSGIRDDLNHPAFMWLTQAYTSSRTKDEIELCALLTAAQMIRSGTTATIDHFPGQCFDEGDLDAVLRGWDRSGMRVALGMRFFDDEFSDIKPRTALPDDLVDLIARVQPLKPQPLDGLGDLMEGAIRRWHGHDGRLSVFPAPSNPERCTDAALQLCAELAERHDTGIHTHLLETAVQAEIAQRKHGCTIVEHMRRLGVLSHRWSCAHSIWLTDADIDLMAEYRMVAVHNPESNLKLGTGLAPVGKMRRRGVTVALGTDGSSANDNLLMHEVIRLAAMLHRPSEPSRADWITAREAFAMATTGGATAMLGGERFGRIAPGQKADLVLYRLDAPWWLPLNDAVAQMVFAETGASADTVLIGGRVVMEAGRILTFDEAAVMAEVAPLLARTRKVNAGVFEVAERLDAYLG